MGELIWELWFLLTDFSEAESFTQEKYVIYDGAVEGNTLLCYYLEWDFSGFSGTRLKVLKDVKDGTVYFAQAYGAYVGQLEALGVEPEDYRPTAIEGVPLEGSHLSKGLRSGSFRIRRAPYISEGSFLWRVGSWRVSRAVRALALGYRRLWRFFRRSLQLLQYKADRTEGKTGRY